MQTSAMLKAEFNDGSGQYIYYFSGEIMPPALPVSSKPLDNSDIVVATVLSTFFGLNVPTVLEYMMPMRTQMAVPTNPQLIPRPDSIGMGVYMSSTNNVSHNNTVSLVCFNEASLRAFISEPFKNYPSDIYVRMQFAPIEQLPQILAEYNPDNVVSIVKDPKLTITRTTPAEFESIASQYLDLTPPFFDAFDLVKERVIRQEPFLDSTGYKPAVYTDNGLDGSNDTIVFAGGYAVTTSFAQLVLLPTIPI